MKKYFSIVFILLLSSVYAGEPYNNFAYGKIVFTGQDLTIEVEVARTAVQRSMGLMYRDSLEQGKGMLFVFERELIQRVWMRNTLIPLDIVFISTQGQIVSIIRSLQPCVKKTCEVYKSTEKAKYMLEVNAGMIDNKGIAIGQMLKIEETVPGSARLDISKE